MNLVDLTVRIRRTREGRFRLWLATKLARLTAWVAGTDYKEIRE